MKTGEIRMNKTRLFITVLIFFNSIVLSGCVKRNLSIISDPPGANVYFNDREIGTTPLDYDFMHYATHKITLKKEGYRPVDEHIKIRCPFYLWMPFDLIFELIPYTFWDRRELIYSLTPQEE